MQKYEFTDVIHAVAEDTPEAPKASRRSLRDSRPSTEIRELLVADQRVGADSPLSPQATKAYRIYVLRGDASLAATEYG